MYEQQQARSIDHFNVQMREVGWGLEFLQLDRGAKPVSVRRWQLPELTLQAVRFENRVHQRGVPPEHSYTFGLPVVRGELRFGAHQVAGDALLSFSSVAGFEAVSEPGFQAFTISVRASRLDDLTGRLGDEPWQPGDESRALARPSNTAQLMLRLQLANLLKGCPSARAALVGALEELLALLLTSERSQPRREPTPAARARAAERALAYMRAHGDRSPTVAEVCAASACSYRTLERAFLERFDITPKRYLGVLRLGAVRRALLTAPGDETIGDVAARFGFWHLSSFAAAYRSQFGELPRETRAHEGAPALASASQT